LYDKQQRQVSSAAGQGDGPQRSAEQRPPVSRPAPSTPPASAVTPSQPGTAPEDPCLAALNAETIQHLHGTLRALPRPLLDSLTRAFRKRFQVPDTAVTIADRICQKCHHDWIEAFLVSHRELRSAEHHR
jgi:hypothetical protein